ncbi:hypothetical protein [Nocardioides sp. 1609]|uniref:hypothetical protein n=1 Tax=Nocardioides sp. 1609 TaxID=2508327 RepID=UPI0010700F7E|nr:hypothetical protein [Nocardioides sp. 1609]
MKTLRPAVLAALALVLAALAACGGSEEPDDADDADEPAPAAASSDDPPVEPAEPGTGSDEPPFPLLEGEPCRAEVTLTGAVEASWESEGAVALGGKVAPTTYESADGRRVVTVYAAGSGFEEASVVLADGAERFGTLGGAAGLDVDPGGAGADVDTDVVTLVDDTETVHVTASFSC